MMGDKGALSSSESQKSQPYPFRYACLLDHSDATNKGNKALLSPRGFIIYVIGPPSAYFLLIAALLRSTKEHWLADPVLSAL